MRIVLALLLIGHGFAHLVGFVVPWKLATLKELPYKTTILGGAVNVGTRWARVLGMVWLLLALTFAATGAGLLLGLAWWPIAACAAVAGSLLMCVIGWPDARFGMAANLLVLVLTFGGFWLNWWPHVSID